MKILSNVVNGLLLVLLAIFCTSIWTRSTPASLSGESSSLTDQEMRGKGLFLQHCSLCHLPKLMKPKSYPAIGPSLEGMFKEADPEKESAVRQLILEGSPNMPAFKYTLGLAAIDDLIAYMKTPHLAGYRDRIQPFIDQTQ